MATIVSRLNTLNTADSTTGAVGNSPSVDTDLNKQGTGCVGFIVKSNQPEFGLSWSSIDLTGQHIRMWVNTSNAPFLATKANLGLQFYVEDSSGRRKVWYIGGSDTYYGGWINICMDLADAGDTMTAGWDVTAITECGIKMVFLISPKNVVNSWVDYARYGDGLTAYGATEFGMQEIYDADLANGYGVVDKYEGVYFLTGNLILGDSAGTNVCNYKDDGETIVFTDRVVSSTLYKFQGVGNATGDTDIVFNNCAIKSAGPIFDIDMDDTSIESFELNGCVVQGADEISFNDICVIDGTTFNACGLIKPADAYFHNNTISNGIGTNALEWPGVSGDVEDCKFYDNINAILISVAVDQVFVGLIFSGNTKDVNNTSGIDLEVSNTVGSNASTWATRLVTFLSAVGFELTKLIAGTEVRVFTGTPGSGAVEIGGIEVSGTTFSMSHSVGGVDGFYVLIKPGYVYEKTSITFSSLDASYPMKQRVDPNYKP